MKILLLLSVFTYSTALAQTGSGAGITQFVKNNKIQNVIQDDNNPSNSVPLPVSFDAAGGLTVQQGAPGTAANGWWVKITDGTNNALVTASQALKVDGSAVTQPISAASLPLPAGASTSALQTTGNASLSSIDTKIVTTANGIKVDGSAVTQPVSAASLPLPAGAATSANQTTGNASLSSIDGKLPAQVGGKVPVDASGSTVTATVSGTVAATQSGTWNINNVSGTVSLPTGASTAANQVTGNASLSSIDGKLGSLGQKTMAGSAPVVFASDQSPLGTKAPVNVTGSISTASISSASTVTAPSNTVGFLIEADDTNSANLRFAVGSTASASNGIQLQPGRSEFVPLGANISICPESGTQKYIVQWVSQ